MPRRRDVPKRVIHPDPKFGDRLVSKFMNVIMEEGKKSVAEGIVYGAFEVIEDKMKEDPIKVFKKALENVKPQVEVRSRRVGGANYQVPVEVPPKRQNALATRWILGAARKKKGKAMRMKLAEELLAAYKGEGEAMTTRSNVHKMAEANKAFAHFAYYR